MEPIDVRQLSIILHALTSIPSAVSSACRPATTDAISPISIIYIPAIVFVALCWETAGKALPAC